MDQRFPLLWPEGWPRTPDHRRQKSRYRPTSKSFTSDRDELFSRLKIMCATTPVLSTNVALRRDGLPYAGQRQPDDTGVAVYFDRKKKAHVVACDAWSTVDENLRACLRTLEALSMIERSGSAQIEDRAYAGFARLPGGLDWRSVLGLRPKPIICTLEEIKKNYLLLVAEAHPDKLGGSHEAMTRVNAAYEAAKKELGG